MNNYWAPISINKNTYLILVKDLYPMRVLLRMTFLPYLKKLKLNKETNFNITKNITALF